MEIAAIPKMLQTSKTYQELWAAIFFRFGIGDKAYETSEKHTYVKGVGV